MKIVTREHHIYYFDVSHKPVVTIEPGEDVLIETEDCFGHQIVVSSDDFDAQFDYSRVNPATGPIRIVGAEPGDTIEVQIKKVRLQHAGVVATRPGWGPLGDKVAKSLAKVVQIRDAGVEFTHHLVLPVKPMIGVIGTTPADKSVPCNTPGPHGGNLDLRWVTERASVYLPVFVSGALLALGDVHAVMGDGEVGGTGVECRAEVLISVLVHKNVSCPFPVICYRNRCYFVASADTIDHAIVLATEKVVSLLQRRFNLCWEEAYMLASVLANIEICQIVNPLKTIRVRIPRGFLDVPTCFS